MNECFSQMKDSMAEKEDNLYLKERMFLLEETVKCLMHFVVCSVIQKSISRCSYMKTMGTFLQLTSFAVNRELLPMLPAPKLSISIARKRMKLFVLCILVEILLPYTGRALEI